MGSVHSQTWFISISCSASLIYQYFAQLTVHSNEKTKKNESSIFFLYFTGMCVVDISYNTEDSGIALIK